MKCDICSYNKWNQTKKLAKCTNCGYVRAADKYFDIDIKDIYNDSYYNEGDYFDYKNEESALKNNFENRLKIIRNYIDNGNLLEIGSAYGYFLEKASKYFNVQGIECNTNLEKYYEENNFSAQFLPVEDAKLQDGYFDLIVSLDTIEHIKSPDLFVKICSKALKTNGFLFIETGDIEAILPKIQKEKWRLIHPPEHLSYLSARTISILLENNGFEVCKIIRVSFTRSLNQIIFRLFSGLISKKSHKIKYILPNINLSINTYDLIFVVAKKR